MEIKLETLPENDFAHVYQLFLKAENMEDEKCLMQTWQDQQSNYQDTLTGMIDPKLSALRSKHQNVQPAIRRTKLNCLQVRFDKR
ncbi:MAG: hypothetical protein AAFX87_13420 [Bacteroidota bacterium]